MKVLSLSVIISLFLILIHGCNKEGQPGLHTAKVLSAPCPPFNQVAVQLDNKDPLSFEWIDPKDGKKYSNVIVTFNRQLYFSVGKTLTYTSVRKPNTTDTLSTAVFAICATYPDTYLENINIK